MNVPEIPQAVTAKVVAKAWDLSAEFVREHREEFGGVKLGKKKNSPVRFPVAALVARLAGTKPEPRKRGRGPTSLSDAHARDRKLIRLVPGRGAR